MKSSFMNRYGRKRAFTLIELPVVRKRGFTLIELLIVIAVIGILATIIIVSFVNAQAKARDNRRRADVQAIASAYQLYYQDHKSWVVKDTSSPAQLCGANSSVWGWFNYDVPPGYYSGRSIASCLEQGKYLVSAPMDPKMKNSNDLPKVGNEYFHYMVYGCPSDPPATATGVKVYANLEYPTSQETTDAQSTIGASLDCKQPNASYGMDYAVVVK